MGLLKGAMLEQQEFDRNRYEELEDMSLQDSINELKKEIHEKNMEIDSILDDDDKESDEKVDLISDLRSDIKSVEDNLLEKEDFLCEHKQLKKDLNIF